VQYLIVDTDVSCLERKERWLRQGILRYVYLDVAVNKDRAKRLPIHESRLPKIIRALYGLALMLFTPVA
jgi:hypothetical protein